MPQMPQYSNDTKENVLSSILYRQKKAYTDHTCTSSRAVWPGCTFICNDAKMLQWVSKHWHALIRLYSELFANKSIVNDRFKTSWDL